MAAKITIGYFLENIGQEHFLTALVKRMAEEKGLPPDRLRHDVRSATGGQGKALGELRRFLHPHIERWYLADPDRLRQVLGVNVVPEVPSYKCERGYYKQILRRTILQTGIAAPLGGLEYGSDIARALDLHTVGKADTGFRHFVDEVRAALGPFVRYAEERKFL